MLKAKAHLVTVTDSIALYLLALRIMAHLTLLDTRGLVQWSISDISHAYIQVSSSHGVPITNIAKGPDNTRDVITGHRQLQYSLPSTRICLI